MPRWRRARRQRVQAQVSRARPVRLHPERPGWPQAQAVCRATQEKDTSGRRRPKPKLRTTRRRSSAHASRAAPESLAPPPGAEFLQDRANLQPASVPAGRSSLRKPRHRRQPALRHGLLSADQPPVRWYPCDPSRVMPLHTGSCCLRANGASAARLRGIRRDSRGPILGVHPSASMRADRKWRRRQPPGRPRGGTRREKRPETLRAAVCLL